MIIKAHKEAEKMDKALVNEIGFGEFKVKSSKGEKNYSITYNELCESECKTLHCRVCKICIHRYKCDCPQYAVKTTMCKHIHLVCLYEQRKGSDSVLGDVVNMLAEGRTSDIKDSHNKEIDQFIEEERKNDINQVGATDDDGEREIKIQTVSNFLRSLDKETFDKYVIHQKTFLIGKILTLLLN